MSTPLMPKSTAVWLVENTSLTFEQIAEFCGLHELEVQGIADGEVAKGIMGVDPIASKQLTKEEIDKCQKDPSKRLKLAESVKKFIAVEKKSKKGKYVPIARRQDKPDAIAWLVKNCPEMTDAQIAKLVGSTKNTIDSIRSKAHWNSANIKEKDPVLLGVCTQAELDKVMAIAKKRAEAKKSDKVDAEIKSKSASK